MRLHGWFLEEVFNRTNNDPSTCNHRSQIQRPTAASCALVYEVLYLWWGALKMLDVKMTDVKLTDQMTGHENAGHEIAGHKRAAYETDSEAANV